VRRVKPEARAIHRAPLHTPAAVPRHPGAMRVARLLLALLSVPTFAVGARAGSFSDDFVPPASKQGVFEYRTDLPPAVLAERSRRLGQFGAGYLQYNLFWSEFESAGAGSSPTPIPCPAGHRMEPPSEAERMRLGFHRFRCVEAAKLTRYDALLRRDRLYGIQSGAVLWSSPPAYRDPGCTGTPGPIGRQSCAPRPDAMDDFEDFMNLVASRWDGREGHGKLSHFILWNENAAPEYFDLSPAASHTDLSPAAVTLRLDTIAEMMRRAHAALMRHQHAALLYVSTDALWAPGLRPGHLGSRQLLDGLWQRLGTTYSWSVAVHPYGRVEAPAPDSVYTYANLGMVARHQEEQLRARGIAHPERAPQMRMIASEQGWGLKEFGGRQGQAEQICRAHAAAMRLPTLVAEANNYFQSIEPAETSAAGESSQGSFFGLLPWSLPATLAGIEGVPTGQAYIATFDAGNWGRSDDHYCCRSVGQGCAGRP